MNPRTTLAAQTALRVVVGFVFFISGLLKFLFENQGALRFAKIGLPAPALTASFVGLVEITGGLCIIFGLFARHAAVPLAIDMVVALATTKMPLLFGAGPEPVAALPKIGVLAFCYQARLDLTMLAACMYLVAVGSGVWSLDTILLRRKSEVRLLDKVRDDETADWS